MSEITMLKCITWGHPRGYETLRATSAAFAKKHPGILIEWDTRSLKEIGDMPIEALIDTYVFFHPLPLTKILKRKVGR